MNKRTARLLLKCSLALLLPLSTMGADGGGCGGSPGTPDGGTTPSGCFPQCFYDLFAACQTTGACTEMSGSSGTDSTIATCYANGVKESFRTSVSGTSITAHGTWYKSDGSVCATSDGATAAGGNTTTYKDASGNVVLTVQAPLTGGVQSYTCGGTTYMVDPTSAACNTGGGGGGCTMGSCTAP